MDWITKHVAIGNYLDARDSALLRQAAVASILSIDGTVQSADATSLGVRRIEVRKLVDGPGNAPDEFVKAVALLSSLVQDAPPVLVQCHAGQSRSVAVVAGYLMKHEGMSEESAMEAISSKRDIAVQPALIDLLSYL